MVKRIVVTLLLAGLICAGIYSTTFAFPVISAEKAILIHLDSGEILYGKNENKKAYPASITKILTALVAIELAEDRKDKGESKGLDEVIKISNAAVGVEGSSIYLQKNERISIRDLLYGLMQRSGNDAAAAIAEEFGGTSVFVLHMNEKAKEVGAISSNFVNPSGLPDENHYTTAKDMALIAREAMKNNEFRKIVSEKTWKTGEKGNHEHTFISKNKVLYEYNGGTGIKIGYTKAAGRTLVASSKRDDIELICVALNAPNWFRDTYSLMDRAYEDYRTVNIAKKEKAINTIKVDRGTEKIVKIGTKNEVKCLAKRKGYSHISLVYDIPNKANAPIERWEKAGILKIYKNERYICSEPLYYLEDIERK